jgi:hypothetical protein
MEDIKMSEQTTVEKWVMTRGMHLGFIKESLSAGTIIEHNLEDRFIKADGRKFDSDKDLDILKRHGWVVPYSEEVVQEIIEQGGVTAVVQQPAPDDKKVEPMKVIKSDADLMGDDIDISHTVTANRKAAEEADDGGLEVIKGDESPEDRVKRLESSIPKMKVVQDDSLGYGDGKAMALNAGKTSGKAMTASEVESIRQENLAKAGIVELTNEQEQIADDHTAAVANVESADQKIARLEAELAAAKGQASTETATAAEIKTVDVDATPDAPDAPDAPAPKKRGRGRPKGSKNKPKSPKRVEAVTE